LPRHLLNSWHFIDVHGIEMKKAKWAGVGGRPSSTALAWQHCRRRGKREEKKKKRKEGRKGRKKEREN
jgi:hypothetical protein